MTGPAIDWTSGCARLVIEVCGACGHRWYFRRPRCPRCSADEPRHHVVSGRGVVVAVTTVHRAPAASYGETPYSIALVDLDEGVRVMGRVEPVARPTDRVEVDFETSSTLPFFAVHNTDGDRSR